MYGDRLAAPDRADTLARLSLDRHLVRCDLEGTGKSLAHLIRVITNLWPIRDHDHINIVDGESAIPHNPTGSRKQIDTRRILPPWIVVRKMLSDVTGVCGAQHGVGNCVANGIGIGVSKQSPVAQDRHAAEHERPVRNQAVKGRTPAQP